MSARVKHFSSALLHALKEERHFALMDGVAFPNRKLARNRFQARNSVRPMHLFGLQRDHDWRLRSLSRGSASVKFGALTLSGWSVQRAGRDLCAALATPTAREPWVLGLS